MPCACRERLVVSRSVRHGTGFTHLDNRGSSQRAARSCAQHRAVGGRNSTSEGGAKEAVEGGPALGERQGVSRGVAKAWEVCPTPWPHRGDTVIAALLNSGWPFRALACTRAKTPDPSRGGVHRLGGVTLPERQGDAESVAETWEVCPTPWPHRGETVIAALLNSGWPNLVLACTRAKLQTPLGGVPRDGCRA